MQIPSPLRRAALVAVALLAISPLAAAAAPPGNPLDEDAPLWVNPRSTTLKAAEDLTGDAREDALLLASVPSASWLTGGTASEVKRDVRRLVAGAHSDAAVPVLVAYNLPFRDCSQYSSGGARSAAEYRAWIDAFAKGIGNKDAVVILEPDGLGIIPWHTTASGELEWCRPAEADPETAATERYEMLEHAVDVLSALPRTAVYLDGTLSAWLNVGDISGRLIEAGVERADGFFLNVSNYSLTEREIAYGTWISRCIDLALHALRDTASCPSQFHPADPGDFSTWPLTDAAFDQAYAEAGLVPDEARQPHFVIDTSRNGVGTWTPTEVYPDPQVWCNPPDRGLGARPTTSTGHALIDAYLWIKVPGESDGECYRGTGGPEDPARGAVDPPAGHWFTEMADELIDNAVPAIAP
ncbi:cellulase [Microbacterium sp. HM58-2]|nr:cellulase [Microbacterium sp. HM58-2]